MKDIKKIQEFFSQSVNEAREFKGPFNKNIIQALIDKYDTDLKFKGRDGKIYGVSSRYLDNDKDFFVDNDGYEDIMNYSSIKSAMVESVNKGNDHPKFSMINKARAKSALKQIKSGKRDDGMGKFTDELFGYKKLDNTPYKITNSKDIDKYEKFGLGKSTINELDIPSSLLTKMNSEVTNPATIAGLMVRIYDAIQKKEATDYSKNQKFSRAIDLLKDLANEKPKKGSEEEEVGVNEAEFKHINSSENKIKLAIKDVEKKFRLKANRDNPPQYAQLSLNKIMLSKVLGREKLGKEHQGAWEKLKQEYNLRESVNEGKEEPIVKLLKTGMFATKGMGEKKLVKLSDAFEDIGDEQADAIASHLNMAIELVQDGYSKSAAEHFNKFNKACKDAIKLMKKQGLAESVNESFFTGHVDQIAQEKFKKDWDQLSRSEKKWVSDEVRKITESVNEVADPSTLEVIGAISTIIGGSLGIKFSMDLLTKIVDKLLKKLNPREAVKLFKDNAPALKAASKQGKEAVRDKLNSLINKPTQSQGKLKEAKPGLWDNIRAKKAKGEKMSSKGSKAYKSAVKSGKKINNDK